MEFWVLSDQSISFGFAPFQGQVSDGSWRHDKWCIEFDFIEYVHESFFPEICSERLLLVAGNFVVNNVPDVVEVSKRFAHLVSLNYRPYRYFKIDYDGGQEFVARYIVVKVEIFYDLHVYCAERKTSSA